MSFFGSIPDPLAGTFSNNNSQQQQWGSQGTPPILPLPEPFDAQTVTPPLSQSSQPGVGLFQTPPIGSQATLFSQASGMNFSFNKFDLNAPVRSATTVFGGPEQPAGFGSPNPAFLASPATSNVSVEAQLEDLMDDDEDSNLSRTESSLSEYKSVPPTPAGIEQYRIMSREQSKLAPHTMKMNLPPPTQQELNDNAAALQRLQQVAGLRESLTSQWNEVHVQHGQLLSAHITTPGFFQANMDAFENLRGQLLNLQQNINEGARTLFEIILHVLADAPGLALVRSELAELELLGAKVDLYLQELRQLSANPGGFPVCVIRVAQQPLPIVMFKGKEIDDTYILQVLLGSQCRLDSISAVRASIVSDNPNFKSPDELENNAADIDTPTMKASMHGIKINVSTRMDTTYFKFHAQIARGNERRHIESDRSFPFIVITNESQWADAAGRLMLLDAFGLENQVQWPQFANTLHSHYLNATSQKPEHAERPIYPYEFKFIHERWFGNKPIVTRAEAHEFWKFFGACLSTIRFKRYILRFWIGGLIFGFIDKSHCSALLDQQGIGAFLIRFSESSPGYFALAHNSGDPVQSIQHSLVRSEDIGSNKNLAEFLRERDQFQLLLYLKNQAEGIVGRAEKDTIFTEFYSKKERPKPAKGYVIL
eukprot:TRINITY_DN15217_c0_g1_i1.p1 TRINITY_DN15217_c0_g1~~TRINITY_DN15217_c0_g1_i1.p1  ORF type:complete len:652 (-),score=137.10 TRINITY_DN15217_c0_g1_i1:1704-3659(-)